MGRVAVSPCRRVAGSGRASIDTAAARRYSIGPMEIVGYSSCLSAEPEHRIDLIVHCERDEYEATLWRLIHGDVSPGAPGFKAAAGRPEF